MSMIAAARVSRAPMAALAAVGLLWGSFAALVPDLKLHAGASDAEMGLILLMSAVGGMISMGAAPRIGAALGARILPVAAGLLTFAAFAPAVAAGLGGLAVALFVMGGTVALLDISANVRISHLEDRHALPLMNLSHAMFSFAFAAAALVTALARAAGAGPWQVMPVIALAIAALGLAMVERDWVPPASDAASDAALDAPWTPPWTLPRAPPRRAGRGACRGE